MDKGARLRGILASPEQGDIKTTRNDVSIRAIDRKKAARVLVELRHGKAPDD
jgi:hypothetical protein